MPGEIPVAIRAEDASFEPLAVTGLACACIRQVPVPEVFGPGVSGAGSIACGEQGLVDISYEVSRDHDTDPDHVVEQAGRSGNGSGLSGVRQLADDSECDDEIVSPVSGLVSFACRERSGDPRCSDPTALLHAGACNSPTNVELFGGPAGRGSALIANSVAVALLLDNGICLPGSDRDHNGRCDFRDYGPDCIPCTDDDLDFGIPQEVLETTEVAKGAVYDAAHLAGFVIGEGSGISCTDDIDCRPHETCARSCNTSGFLCTGDPDCDPGDFCRPLRCEVDCRGGGRCQTSARGMALDCDRLLSPDVARDPTGGLGGGRLAVAWASIDARQIGDNVMTAVLAFPDVAVSPPPCSGDCDGDGAVSVAELLRAVGLALSAAPPTECSAADPGGDGAVTIDELTAAVRNGLRGCEP
jgi:hypothetical protein